jgi:hypothetical protein
MTRKDWLDLGPSLLVGAGIVVSTLIAVLAARSGWLILGGPLVLALAVVSADVMDSRLRGESSGPSRAALLLGGAFLLASAIVALRDPSLVKMLIPVFGAAGWVTLLLRPGGRRKPCRESNQRTFRSDQ